MRRLVVGGELGVQDVRRVDEKDRIELLKRLQRREEGVAS
jgi:hypothetical protein